MFVIPSKYSRKSNYVVNLVKEIRHFHPNDSIVIVDSDSSDKSYFKKLQKFDVQIEDVQNQNWNIGAYWHSYNKFPDEEFYFFMHDSMHVKANLHYLTSNPVTTICYFDRTISNFNNWEERVNQETNYSYNPEGLGCYGPSFFVQNHVMEEMARKGANKLLPSNKEEIGYCEGSYGFFLEDQGFDLKECALFGDVLENESLTGKSGPPPHNTSWQFPVEKFYGSHRDKKRL